MLDCRENLPEQSKSLQSASMISASSDTAQTFFLLPDLEKQLDLRHLLYRLAKAIDWKAFEEAFFTGGGGGLAFYVEASL